MRRALTFLALLVLAAPAFAENTALVIRRSTVGGSGGGGGGIPFALESIGPGISSGTVTSSSMSFTTTSSTTLLALGVVYRDNTGQGINSCTWNGSEFFTWLNGDHGQMSASTLFLRNPSAGTHNIVCTLTATTAGFAMNAAAYTGVHNDPIMESAGNAGSVTTSTVTQTTTSGQLLMSVLVKQDPSTSTPVLNTAGAFKVFSSTFSSSGSGGFFDITTTTATTPSTSLNYSWTSAANHAHTMMVIAP